MPDQKVEKTPEELFAESFASAAEEPKDEGSQEQSAEGSEESQEPAAEGAEPAGEPAAEGAEDKQEPAVEGKQEPTSAEPAPAVEDKQEPVAVEPDLKAEVARLTAELEAAKKAPAKTAADIEPEPAQAVKAPEVPTLASVLTDEEAGIVASYEEEWPDVAKAEALKRKVDNAILEDRIYREVATALKGILGSIDPIVQSAQQTADEKHYAAIEAAHPDYLEVVKDIDNWIEKQPKYLQVAMNNVLDSGSAVEVNDLFTRYKQETGRVAPQVKADQTLLQNKPAVDSKIVDAMAPVEKGRGAPITSEVDPNDFAGAWKDAAAK